MLQKVYCIGVLFVLYQITVPINCDNTIDLDKIKAQLPDGISTDLFPSSMGNVSLPSAEDAKKIIRQKCLKESGNNESSYEQAELATTNFKNCVSDLINVTALQMEIEEATPNGELDTVFNKYCRKRTIAIECINNFTDSIDQCLNENEISNKKTFVNIFTNLLNFVCHKDGDQIALFIAEKGPECFNSKKEGITNCINSTLSGYMPTETPSIDNLPQLIITAKQCAEMDNLQRCIVHELESCEETTPANLVESAFKFIRNETPCKNMTTAAPVKAHQRGAAIDLQKTSYTLIASALIAVVARFLI